MTAQAALTAVAKETMDAIGWALPIEVGDTGEVLAAPASGMNGGARQIESGPRTRHRDR